MAKRRKSTNGQQSERATVGYIRVSTEAQAEIGLGLQVQKERIKAYATSQGLTTQKIFADEGVSGSTLERPAMQELIEAIKRREIERVIIYKLDRISRNLRNLLNLYEDVFLKSDCALVSISENFDTHNPQGKLFFQLIGSFAEFERAVITERVTSGRRLAMSKGQFGGGGVPLGYKSAGRGSKQIVVDPAKAETVKRTFRLRESGLPLKEIARRLNDEGHTTATGKPFSHVQVLRVLAQEPFYRGERTVCRSLALTEGVEAQHQAIL
jgi:DNA invertase Pin-like site-specific DNA recombinase